MIRGLWACDPPVHLGELHPWDNLEVARSVVIKARPGDTLQLDLSAASRKLWPVVFTHPDWLYVGCRVKREPLDPVGSYRYKLHIPDDAPESDTGYIVRFAEAS